jgi:hypothetical protein
MACFDISVLYMLTIRQSRIALWLQHYQNDAAPAVAREDMVYLLYRI